MRKISRMQRINFEKRNSLLSTKIIEYKSISTDLCIFRILNISHALIILKTNISYKLIVWKNLCSSLI